MLKAKQKNAAKKVKRQLRVRKHLRGTPEKPRLSVVKTNKNIIVQLIDDENRVTLVSTGTLCSEFKNTEFAKKSKASAKKLGEIIGKKAKEKNINKVVFDRGSHKYHGILAELANAARESGLEF